MCDNCLIAIAEKNNITIPDKFQYEVCKEEFRTRTCFVEHIKYDFSYESLEFKCEECDQLLNSDEHLQNHENQKHTIHACIQCDRTFAGKENLNLHYRARHRAFSYLD